MTRAAVILACLAMPVEASHGQQSSIQSGPELPAESLDLQIKKPVKPSRDDDSEQQNPVSTHMIRVEPDDPPKPGKPQGTASDDADAGQETASGDNQGAEESQTTESNRGDNTSTGARPDESPQFGAQTPAQRDEPSARDFARYRRDSLLNRPPTGFTPVQERDRPRAGTELDPDAAFEPCELLVMSETMAEAQRVSEELSGMSIDIKRRFSLPGLGIVLSVFCVPEPGETERAIEELTQQYPALTVTLNHRYVPAAERNYYATAIGWRDELYVCGAGRRIGLVDTGVDVRHRAFTGARVTTKNLLSPGTPAADMEHGTATASVLAGASGEAPGLVRSADLVAVNVFRGRSGNTADTNAELLVRAIDWLLGEGAELINMSLAGPANSVLEHAVEAAAASGVPIVAAAGNGDRNPVYPAAYPGVIAVTAVDARTRVYARANRGGYIDFAAPGVDLYLAAPENRGKYYTGTSFATPFVTAALAALKTLHPDWDAAVLREQLASGAVDLGDAGRDSTFGWGLIQAPNECRSLAARQ